MSTLMGNVRHKCQVNRTLENLWNPLNSVMMASRQDQTKRAYDCAFKAFVNWCKVTSQSHMPASTETIALADSRGGRTRRVPPLKSPKQSFLI